MAPGVPDQVPARRLGDASHARAGACGGRGAGPIAPLAGRFHARTPQRSRPRRMAPADAALRRRSRFDRTGARSEEHTSELQSLMRISYAVFCLKKKKTRKQETTPE